MAWNAQPAGGERALLAAFLAGNLKAQIDKKTNKPEPYAGVLAVIDVYNAIKDSRADTKAGFHLATVEGWISLEKQGKLRAEIEKE